MANTCLGPGPGIGLALASALGFSAQTAACEEFTVATFVPPQHRTNATMIGLLSLFPQIALFLPQTFVGG
ncbi:hypothetical protein [Hoeflea sp. AS16]|uniref:hypothetical protein n=1 Tax=Hoeflea sp. AS16 TaxID=3135779 RepID=UPI00316DD7A6